MKYTDTQPRVVSQLASGTHPLTEAVPKVCIVMLSPATRGVNSAKCHLAASPAPTLYLSNDAGCRVSRHRHIKSFDGTSIFQTKTMDFRRRRICIRHDFSRPPISCKGGLLQNDSFPLLGQPRDKVPLFIRDGFRVSSPRNAARIPATESHESGKFKTETLLHRVNSLQEIVPAPGRMYSLYRFEIVS